MTNNYFVNVTKLLNLKDNLKKQISSRNGDTNKFDSHISIKWWMNNILSFEYELVFYNDVQKEVENINTKTSSIYGSAPEPLIK